MIDSHYVLVPISLPQLRIGLVTQHVLEKLFTSISIVNEIKKKLCSSLM